MTVGTPLKQVDLSPCIGCNKNVAHANGLLFYRLSFERLAFNVPAIRRQHGLEMMLGNAAIARVMGPNEDISVAVDVPVHALLCDDCACSKPIAVLHEIYSDRTNAVTEQSGDAA